MTRRPVRGLAALALTLAAALALTSCTASGSAHGAGGPATPPLSSVTPETDPLAWEGPSTAIAASAPIDPVTDGAPALPATVTDAQGSVVTVSDTSRILAPDGVHLQMAFTPKELRAAEQPWTQGWIQFETGEYILADETFNKGTRDAVLDLMQKQVQHSALRLGRWARYLAASLLRTVTGAE